MNDQDTKIWEAFLKEASQGNFRAVFERTSGLVYTICYRVLKKTPGNNRLS